MIETENKPLISIENSADKQLLEKEFEKNKEKFKLLYEVASQEHKDAITYVDSIKSKVINLFTLLNVILTLSIAFLASSQSIDLYKHFSKNIQIILLLLIAHAFIFLLVGWGFLFTHLKSAKFLKIDLKHESEIVKTVFEDQKDINYLYFLLYKNYQEVAEVNTNIANATIKSLDTAWKFIMFGFILICVIVSFLYVLAFIGVIGS